MPDHYFAMQRRSQIDFLKRGTASLTEGDSGGASRLAWVSGLGDHIAHHRGALADYARLCGRVPAMPYA